MNSIVSSDSPPTSSPAASAAKIQGRAEEIFRENLIAVFRKRDGVLAVLMAGQWVFGLLLALNYSPYAWSGRTSSLHVHVYFALFVGAAVSGAAILLGLARPGWLVTRHVMATCQMLWSALFIHLTGGRIETHFHIFGSLAFLGFYRDVPVLATATLVVLVDHFLRGALWPESIYGITNPESWRFLEHGFWLFFEDSVIILGIVENRREMRNLAARQAESEIVNQTIEHRVIQRTEELERSREQYRALVETTRSVPWQFDLAADRYSYVGPQGPELLQCTAEDWLTPGFWHQRVHPEDREKTEARFVELIQNGGEIEVEYRMRRDDGTFVTVRSYVTYAGFGPVLRGLMIDMTEQRRLEFELNQAQKLESVGRLASGIAHEINTPIQFVNDSIHFLQDAFTSTSSLLAKYREVLAKSLEVPVSPPLRAELTEAEEEADLEYLSENVPKALERSLDGLSRVAVLVKSMKEFAHPDQKDKVAADLNHALSTTLTIARNEYKYVAEVETDFGEIPSVICHVNELNQGFLNIIVNAAHAIGDMVKGTDHKGRIAVKTRLDGDHVLVTIADTGGGIPEQFRSRVFEPFFTTKEVGRGTGQGLSIARSVVVDKHGGTLSFESVMGQGTMFFIRLPVTPANQNQTPEVAA